VLAVLDGHGVDFVVIGGIAVIAHGHPRNTRDIDFVAATDRVNLERLAAALRELGARISGVDADLRGIELDAATLGNGANHTMVTDAGGLDYFNAVSGGVPYEELRARALVVELPGLTLRVAGRDDLIRMKLAGGRPQDLDDVAALTEPPES
jgi:predicted nucleotidyltransferase